MPSDNPDRSQPPKAFWRRAIAERHYSDLEELWGPIPLTRSDRIATAGSCFAQHIGNNLQRRGATFLDLEPAPPVFADEAEARRFGFGVYSCRYGNIYTSRQLLQLFDEAFGHRTPTERVWGRDGRFFDALRPSVDPVGQEDAATVLALRGQHLGRVREMFRHLDLFVFTMGLTEGWEAVADGTMYPAAPGTICGSFDAEKYRFHNLRYGEILQDMQAFWERLKGVNPQARMLLTVSPVPLTTTATGGHVLTATTYSKSVLRAVAGDLAADHAEIGYFVGFEQRLQAD
ncbi:GSCFA domain-containing protein [Aestuariicoccus sp. MJ-SS9]|uniref:GSCFA domain-containing protein n=1 Tax=Aestuariicoccus sp. MJ-SS9 TaxID=3079855 RepID=UPI0029149640|nr:GSCFA domain-containing protein [Aestuariicoccus sp. MJ-SS9]MDU8914030.1 GSCFA domain-containing protein [Aestuariicoccus sp. MJ-SS9]